MDEALYAINRAIMLTLLNSEDKESGWDVQKAATAKQQKQVEEHVAKAITRLLDEDHATVAQNYNNKSMKGWKGKKLSNLSANSNLSLNCKMCPDLTDHSTEDCNKLKNFMKLKDQFQKVRDDPTVKNAKMHCRNTMDPAQKKTEEGQSPVQKKLLELANVKDKAIDHELDTICQLLLALECLPTLTTTICNHLKSDPQ
ncbi:hypothetical protein BC830DRAFT_1204574 [Chytriomyces sp. MP71]|nr:hypothetical protein BC830DRAFT_1204574 [Chytriomyces sp. MP71]